MRSRLLVCMLFLCLSLPCPSLRNIYLVLVSCTCSFGFLTICSVAQSCPTLCGHKVCNPPGSSARGIFQASILEWIAISYSRDLPDPGIKPASLGLLHWQEDSLPLLPSGKSPIDLTNSLEENSFIPEGP